MKREEIMKFAATYDTEGYIRACGKRNADDLTVEEVKQWYLLNNGGLVASYCVIPKYLKFMPCSVIFSSVGSTNLFSHAA